MGQKKNNISLLFESNRSRIVEATIKSNFLEQLKVNEGCAFKHFLSSIYKGNFVSKKIKENKIRNLKNMWKKNKELLTKEINEFNKPVKNPKSFQKTLGVEHGDIKNPKKYDCSSTKQKGNMERAISIHDKPAIVVEDTNPLPKNRDNVSTNNCSYFFIYCSNK